MAFPPPTSLDVVDLGNGVTVQWLGAIIHFHLTGVVRAAIDTWMDNISIGVDLLPADAPVLLLHELPEMPVTPYMRQRSEAIVLHYKDKRHGRTAVLLPESVFGAIIRNFTERDLSRVSKSFERRLFSDRETAIKWLLEIS